LRKVEGNPDHPGSLGATDVFAQASILGLYDPDRAQALTNMADIRPWPSLLAEIGVQVELLKQKQGAGFRLLTETVNSPTLAWQIQRLLQAYPQAKWHQYEPLGNHAARAGAQLAFGRYVAANYRLDRAGVVLALDSDFLSSGPGSVRYARDFAQRRKPPEMNRLYAVESSPSSTGASADHRLPLRASEVEGFARAVAAYLGIGSAPAEVPYAKWAAAVARDLEKHKGASLVIAGEQQSPAVYALAHAVNQALGNVGSTVVYIEPVEAKPVDQMESLRELVQDIDAGQVEWLVLIGGNPVYTAPADLAFSDHLLKVRWTLQLSSHADETATFAHWHVPEAHYLESWSDARAYDGTVSIVQPLIAPLYGGKTAHEILSIFTGQPERTSYDIVRDYWKTQHADADFEQFWRKSLNDGIVAGTAGTTIAVTAKTDLGATAVSHPAASGDSTLEVLFRPDPAVFDGRFANNGWLQELPKPITKLTWDNAALISPATAERLGFSYTVASTGGEHGQILADLAELEYQGWKKPVPVWIVPGHADGSVTLPLGYGRERAGQVGTGHGFNANALRLSTAPWFGAGATLRKTGGTADMACTQFHYNMEGRAIIRAASLEEYRDNPHFATEKEEEVPKGLTLYPEHKYEDYAWGMTIDLNACTGCSACVVACQAENNIPVVGKEQVHAGREMHWIRIDRYYEGRLENPDVYFQPVPCMQCENAPCEVVCPTGATVHSSEGLNDMVYNRCVGTRYCSNNCPYKVRRFNFLAFSDWDTPSLKLGRNPDVTVRSRGVMEKCTYCVQRINNIRITAEKEDRSIRDGEIITACQQVCPTQAITFGNINDRNSQVARKKADPRNYSLLGDLNTRPRTTYLAAVRNTNPEIEEAR
jgi:Fe-S-cluster-containing dehydrogenase component